MSSTAFIWSDFSFPSPVDDILKRPNFKLEDLLDEDDVVVDTRSQKEGLKEFLVQKETLVALIKYISEDAPSGASDTVKFRYPAVACEILTAEVVEIDTGLVSDSELVSALFSFFCKENVNPLLANLVLRVISALMTTRLGTLLDYMRLHPDFLGNLLNHLNCAAVPEFILRLVGAEAEYEGKGTLQWLVDNKFVEQLISRFSPEYINLHSDLTRTVIEIVVSSSESSPLVQRFYTKENVKLLLNLVMKEGNDYGFRAGLAVVSQLLRVLSLSSSLLPLSDGRDLLDSSLRPERVYIYIYLSLFFCSSSGDGGHGDVPEGVGVDGGNGDGQDGGGVHGGNGNGRDARGVDGSIWYDQEGGVDGTMDGQEGGGDNYLVLSIDVFSHLQTHP
eukprot:TRINITY_DN2800_c0_g1_i12.p1 TRINITY_DN2800_c0_g1~~TRINITY_DN2800_c0_g1_i12.p1  ORF type:complete len:390 (-),score=73.04 TRINITY_DN2800_c0_g1_i12:914-2083(-)